MINRRDFLKSASATAVAARTAAHATGRIGRTLATGMTANEEGDWLRYVDPMIGTGGDGHCFPGATLPFGAVQLSPDTGLQGWGHCSGYRYDDSSIFAFSHTHLSGTGVGDMYDFGVLPLTEMPRLVAGVRPDLRFAHADEKAEPGFYSVRLANGVVAELTATERTGIHRYTFPAGSAPHLLIDLTEEYAEGPQSGEDRVVTGSLHSLNPTSLAGFRRTAAWAKNRKQFIAMKFSRPYQVLQIFEDATPLPGHAATGQRLRALLRFDAATTQTLIVKAGISGVDQAGASKNLAAEASGWQFELYRQQARSAWRRMLGRFSVEGGTTKQKRIFFTSLYHALLAPTLFDDTDGRYLGMDDRIHTLATGEHNYSTYSLWDTYRAAHPLLTVAYPECVPPLINCLIRMANESPQGPPVWPLQAKETLTMTGYHSAVVIAEAAVKQFPNLRLADAWEPFRKRAMVDDFRGLALYRAKGYIPCDLVSESCSKTTDYCYDDWAVAHLARALGHETEAKALIERSANYQNLFDSGLGFIRPKLNDGSWSVPFAPNEMGHSSRWRDYTESKPWQTTFAMPHDPVDLARLLGGRAQLESKLDGIFDASPAQPPDAPSDIAGLVGQYAHGNEPSHHIAYLYVYAGAPHKTQQRVRMLCETMYRDAPDGIAGNDDCGQIAAWYVMSAMGFYPVDPVSGNYVVGTPMFDRVTIEIGRGQKLSIAAKRSAADDVFVSGFSLNGTAQDRLWFHHRDIAGGGRLDLTLNAAATPEFGSAPSSTPPCKSNPEPMPAQAV